ncbi:ROK family transcriptional regulator [Nocardioides donggukensis]|uniref:ROK family transcriptional regulator n=1 Tax=Nocardioides donggukensis TaxID=2774019 RepID=A0A927PZ72_9ACTN|nr:ROK family transcriptional regulator [Nocardioides donggukensis]MBD8868575.1 ROK family transcriptional regulator [Nocardioides donggukensis]
MPVRPAATSAPGSTASLRTANQARVVNVLRGRAAELPADGTPVTQAELARLTGLAPATVSNIVRHLASAGLVDTEPGSGRRGTTVRLARSAGLVAGIDFGHRHVAVALGDLSGALVAEDRRRLHAEHAYDEGLEIADGMLTALLAEHGHGVPVRNIGLGLPAPISDDLVRSSAILPGWVGVNAREVTSGWFDRPVHTENDANLGALAEHRHGVARGHATSVFLKISSGVGAGLIVDNRLFRGADGTAGEIGHLTLDEQGPVCRCGSRGCLEAYASIGTVEAMLANQLPDAGIDRILAAARDGNVSAVRTLEDAGLHVGWGLAAVVNLLNPDLIVVGGEMARAGDLLLHSVRIGMRRHAVDAAASTPVVASELGERASLIGAVLLAADRTEIAVGP